MAESRTFTGPLCAALAFYGGWHNPNSAAAFYKHVVGWYKHAGYPLNSSSIKRNGRRSRLSNQVVAKGFEGVDSLEMYAASPEAINSMGNHIRCAFWGDGSEITQPLGHHSDAFLWHEADAADLCDASLREAARRFMVVDHTAYAIGYRRPRGFGPSQYASSVLWQPNATTPPLDEEEDHAWAWHLGLDAQIYNVGVLRDVYPLNYVNPSQLANRIENSTLADWVRADPTRGSLSEVEGTLLNLWEVPDASLDAVRAAAAGLIFNRNRYIASLGDKASEVPTPHPSRLR